MILFVFEGKKREPEIFKTLEYLYFPKGQTIVCSFGNNIYELYRQLETLHDAGDIVSLLRERNTGNPDTPFPEGTKSSDFSEIFLFFDYDFQNKNLSIEEMNRQISQMLDMFSDETDMGKLYINYPMLEAIRYTQELPDKDFNTYTISQQECQAQDFKNLAQQFSFYGSLDFIVLNLRKTPPEKIKEKTKRNWELLKEQNVKKANHLCNGQNAIPTDKGTISQQHIFAAQLKKYITPSKSVAILSAFPIFNFDYFK